MIRQIMLEEITEDIVKFKDSITVTISQHIPQPIINDYRIVKNGSRRNDDNSQYVLLEDYRKVVKALFNSRRNFVRFLKKNNNYIFEESRNNF